LNRADTTRSIDRNAARKYLAKAGEFLATAETALGDERWNAAGLNAIHAGISAADAVVVASAGVRSAAKDHGAIVDLLQSSVDRVPAASMRQLSGLLGMKNTVEYEQRLLKASEARTLVQQAGRFCAWATESASAKLGDSEA
jgi:hypothetical protein